MEPKGELRLWADEAQYAAAPLNVTEAARGVIIPKVELLWMTPDPLGSIAAMCRMYEGKPTYSLYDVTDDERRHYFDQAQKTHLKAPLEAVKFHFFIEGVTRSFTHQLVRQRTAVYAQESLRFAVKENIIDEVSLPPSLAGTTPLTSEMAGFLPDANKQQRWRNRWDECVMEIQSTYDYLVNDGMPAEDARGLLPHAIATRANYVTDLRNMIDHAGNRLCTQAQFEWRIVFLGIIQAIRDYNMGLGDSERWQYEQLATSSLFRPVCYALGHCPFQASFDRACTIRGRVDEGRFNEIDPAEWMLDPAAARTQGGAGHE